MTHLLSPETSGTIQDVADNNLAETALTTGEAEVGLLQLLPVSAWTLKPDGTPDFVNQVWLEFAGQTLDFVRSHPEAWMTAVHPEDREAAAKSFWEGVRSGQGFAFETRFLRARDGTYRWRLQQAVVLRDAEGKVRKFVGTTTDIDDQKRNEEALRHARSELAHVARVVTLNAMTASLAHEVSQPLSGILTNADTCVRMLAADPPNLAGAVETARRTVRDANRASEVIWRLRAMFSTKTLTTELADLNEVAREVIALSTAELRRSRALLHTDFANDLPHVRADRVQLQQVILNLLLNAADAMVEVEDRPRTILIKTSRHEDGSVDLAVRDSGEGVDPDTVEKLFEAFYTTKANGMGVGLSICRSIIESHHGRLWAKTNDGPGATFGFCIPSASRSPVTPFIANGPGIDLVAAEQRSFRSADRDRNASAAPPTPLLGESASKPVGSKIPVGVSAKSGLPHYQRQTFDERTFARARMAGSLPLASGRQADGANVSGSMLTAESDPLAALGRVAGGGGSWF